MQSIIANVAESSFTHTPRAVLLLYRTKFWWLSHATSEGLQYADDTFPPVRLSRDAAIADPRSRPSCSSVCSRCIGSGYFSCSAVVTQPEGHTGGFFFFHASRFPSRELHSLCIQNGFRRPFPWSTVWLKCAISQSNESFHHTLRLLFSLRKENHTRTCY